MSVPFHILFHLFWLVNPNFFKKCDPCKPGIQCVPSIQCPAVVRMRSSEKPQICDLPHGGHGYCCTTGRKFTNHRKSITVCSWFFFWTSKACLIQLPCQRNVSDSVSFCSTVEKFKIAFSKGRSATSDVATNIFKVVNAVIREATEHLTDLDAREPEVAVINPHDQPQFMHNLMFR